MELNKYYSTEMQVIIKLFTSIQKLEESIKELEESEEENEHPRLQKSKGQGCS